MESVGCWTLFDILVSWIVDESEWPQKSTLKMFREWFDIEYKSMAWDMGSEPLMIDDFDDDSDVDDMPETGAILH